MGRATRESYGSWQLNVHAFFPRAPANGSSQKNICRTTSRLHLHIFTSAHLHFHLYLSAHLHIFTHLHDTSSHLHIYIIPAHLHSLLFTSGHLHLCSSSHPHICTSHIFTSRSSGHLHLCSSSHPHICTSHIFTSRSSLLPLLRPGGGAAGASRNATLCGDRARRGSEMQARLRFGPVRRNPLRRLRASRARNAGEIAIWPGPAQPSAEIVRVEGAK